MLFTELQKIMFDGLNCIIENVLFFTELQKIMFDGLYFLL